VSRLCGKNHRVVNQAAHVHVRPSGRGSQDHDSLPSHRQCLSNLSADLSSLSNPTSTQTPGPSLKRCVTSLGVRPSASRPPLSPSCQNDYCQMQMGHYRELRRNRRIVLFPPIDCALHGTQVAHRLSDRCITELFRLSDPWKS